MNMLNHAKTFFSQNQWLTVQFINFMKNETIVQTLEDVFTLRFI